MKKSLYLFIIIFCFVDVKGQNLSQQLINIHDVSNIAEMNAISNPNQRSLVYVTNQDLTYQYVGSQWVPLSGGVSIVDSLYIDSLITVTNFYNNLVDSCCGINTSSPNILKVGDVFGCGIVFYISPDWTHALIVALDEFDSQWGCNGQITGANNEYDGMINTNIIIGSNCTANNDAANVCVNYQSQDCNDWYLPTQHELRTLMHNFVIVNAALSSMSRPIIAMDKFYWQSIDSNNNNAFAFSYFLSAGGQTFLQLNSEGKTSFQGVRPIRKHTF